MKDSKRMQRRKNKNYIRKILLISFWHFLEIIWDFIVILLINLYIFISLLLKKSPKISIFLPIYNKAKYINRSIGSIQMQTLKNIEIIPVNDCSEDNTLDILKKMAKNDSRIKIISNKKNEGLLYSRAMGILNSKGEYIMNLDPDDKLEGPDNLEFLYNKASQAKIDIISFGLLKEQRLNKNKNTSYQLKKLIKYFEKNWLAIIYVPSKKTNLIK